MATDFEAEGMLDGLEGDAREARRKLLEALESDGYSRDDLKQAVAEGRLALLPVEQALEPPGERYTFAQVAEKAGLETPFLESLIRALGLPVPPDPDEATLAESDLAA